MKKRCLIACHRKVTGPGLHRICEINQIKPTHGFDWDDYMETAMHGGAIICFYIVVNDQENRNLASSFVMAFLGT